MNDLYELLAWAEDPGPSDIASVVVRLAAGDEGDARTALAAVARNPRAVIHLDEAIRRVGGSRPRSGPPDAAGAAWRSVDDVPPLALVLASAARDGRVRERAVAVILARPVPDLIPFLVLRTTDWVSEVRTRARAGLALLLHSDPGLLAVAAPVGLRVEGWVRGSFARRQLAAAASGTSLEPLLASRDRRVRWFAFTSHRWEPGALAELALVGRDARLRSAAAEAAARDAVWTNRVAVLRRLSRSKSAEVRAQALAGLAKLGHDADVAAHLVDPHPLVRALARASARRLGVDVVAHYRSVVSKGALDGLAEVGSEADTGYLVGLLDHPVAVIRARAVRALRVLRVQVDDEVVPLLRDPSAAVVREAVRAVRRVPDGLPWELLADERTAVRRAGYSLARRRHALDRLRAALTAAVDPDPKLARRGVADAVHLARHPWERWEERPGGDLSLLGGLLDRAAPVLHETVVQQLRVRLVRAGATPRP